MHPPEPTNYVEKREQPDGRAYTATEVARMLPEQRAKMVRLSAAQLAVMGMNRKARRKQQALDRRALRKVQRLNGRVAVAVRALVPDA